MITWYKDYYYLVCFGNDLKAIIAELRLIFDEKISDKKKIDCLLKD